MLVSRFGLVFTPNLNKRVLRRLEANVWYQQPLPEPEAQATPNHKDPTWESRNIGTMNNHAPDLQETPKTTEKAKKQGRRRAPLPPPPPKKKNAEPQPKPGAELRGRAIDVPIDRLLPGRRDAPQGRDRHPSRSLFRWGCCEDSHTWQRASESGTGFQGLIPIPFFSIIVLFKNRLFSLGFWRFSGKKDPRKEWRRFP